MSKPSELPDQTSSLSTRLRPNHQTDDPPQHVARKEAPAHPPNRLAAAAAGLCSRGGTRTAQPELNRLPPAQWRQRQRQRPDSYRIGCW